MKKQHIILTIAFFAIVIVSASCLEDIKTSLLSVVNPTEKNISTGTSTDPSTDTSADPSASTDPSTDTSADPNTDTTDSTDSADTTDSTDSADTAIAYNRKNWKHWIDENKDCQNTRHEVLIEENIGDLVLSENGCTVASGVWNDPYTGNTYTNPSDLDIDHYVPLKEAWLSGAMNWNSTRKQNYANDLSNNNHLIAVYKGANQSKGARDPSGWLPSNVDYVCEYVRTWTSVKQTWGLAMDAEETQAINDVNVQHGCN